MQKPAMPNIASLASLPGMGAMSDTLEFVKNLWGGMSAPNMGIPGMVMPTLSVEEIDKQIKDLKAVESWLNVNMTMLRGTIQALEVQSATITTIKSMGQTLGAAVTQSVTPRDNGARAAAAEAAADEAREDARAEERIVARRKSREALKKEFSAKAAPEAPASKAAATGAAAAGSDGQNPNPALWWNLLQDQFKQAVSTAMKPDAMTTAAKTAKSAMESMAKSVGMPVAKTAVKAAPKSPAKASPKAGTSATGKKVAAKKSARKPAGRK
jgi:hypothetical protein